MAPMTMERWVELWEYEVENGRRMTVPKRWDVRVIQVNLSRLQEGLESLSCAAGEGDTELVIERSTEMLEIYNDARHSLYGEWLYRYDRFRSHNGLSSRQAYLQWQSNNKLWSMSDEPRAPEAIGEGHTDGHSDGDSDEEGGMIRSDARSDWDVSDNGWIAVGICQADSPGGVRCTVCHNYHTYC